MKELKKKSYAKLNLGLQVLNKRPDGFHNINSVFIKINLFDEIVFRHSDSFSIKSGLNIPQEDNIIYKTIDKLSSFFKRDLFKFEITLKKHIPLGAGLGGGSSNAAETLKACIELFNLEISNKELVNLAAEIGSDVPFFLYDSPAHATSKGEILTPFNFKLPYHILVIYPNIHISTPQAYKMLGRTDKPLEPINFKTILDKFVLDKMKLKNTITNDFEKPVFATFPEIGEIKNRLYDLGSVLAVMSGSGSSVIGLFENLKEAEYARKSFDEYKTFITEKI